MSRRNLLPCIVIVALVATALSGCDDVPSGGLPDLPTSDSWIPPAPTTAPPVPGGEAALVTYVVDGDTIEVQMNGGTYRVRYIGINTPEWDEPCGEEASAANAVLVSGQTVTMVRDVSEVDPYGRLLRYVYVGDLFVNEYLVAQGWAEAVEYPPDTAFADYFEALEAEAAARGLGCHPTGVFGD